MKVMAICLMSMLVCASCYTNSSFENELGDSLFTKEFSKDPGEKQSDYTLDQFDQAVEALTVAEPTRRDPLQMNAMLIPAHAAPGETVVAVIKVRLMAGWHFYKQVPDTSPYIEAKWHMELEQGLKAVDDWAGPSAQPYSTEKPDLKVYKGSQNGSLVFFRELVVEESLAASARISIGLFYQTCDENICLKPRKKMVDIDFLIGA